MRVRSYAITAAVYFVVSILFLAVWRRAVVGAWQVDTQDVVQWLGAALLFALISPVLEKFLTKSDR